MTKRAAGALHLPSSRRHPQPAAARGDEQRHHPQPAAAAVTCGDEQQRRRRMMGRGRSSSLLRIPSKVTAESPRGIIPSISIFSDDCVSAAANVCPVVAVDAVNASESAARRSVVVAASARRNSASAAALPPSTLVSGEEFFPPTFRCPSSPPPPPPHSGVRASSPAPPPPPRPRSAATTKRPVSASDAADMEKENSPFLLTSMMVQKRRRLSSISLSPNVLAQLSPRKRKSSELFDPFEDSAEAKEGPSSCGSSSKKAVCVTSASAREDLRAHGLESTRGLRLLGKGAYGTVVLGTLNGDRVAVKVIASHGAVNGRRHRAESIHGELNPRFWQHENIVKVLGVFAGEADAPLGASPAAASHASPARRASPAGRASPLDSTRPAPPAAAALVVMEYVGQSNLHSVIVHSPHLLHDRFVARASKQIASALAFCHDKGVVHLDVKPGNVFVTAKGTCKLGDFGCSRRVMGGGGGGPAAGQSTSAAGQSSSGGGGRPQTLVGTPGYQAPEFLRNARPTAACDVYAFGILLWQLATHAETPYPGMHPHVIIYKVASSGLRPVAAAAPSPSPSGLAAASTSSANAKDFRPLYEDCWAEQPQHRPSMKQVVQSLECVCSAKRRRRLSTASARDASGSPSIAALSKLRL